ncbi:hypothetical protein GL50803_0014933 [Giardia duodenalis]|uniref:Uncharacterized protein n=1 Tax=Giardia intestinalis (strain ATCC 50803 / WB clone C6) TaxID=184922 RepID=A8B507_GIAIC|nr:hypothetical protein GL50803_0014933 [Giardia intestinalis]KAE8303815.1 hypothetical protein GL50803_0014933 [Giardia intestinalis]|eukprot:XP_001709743.1 Hypothetical protein GL50803_14933 [Giardia lamblia ATCC 50803]
MHVIKSSFLNSMLGNNRNVDTGVVSQARAVDPNEYGESVSLVDQKDDQPARLQMSEQTAATLAQLNLQPPTLSHQAAHQGQLQQQQQLPPRQVQLPPVDNRYSSAITSMSDPSNCNIPGMGREPMRVSKTPATDVTHTRSNPPFTEPAKPTVKKSINEMTDAEYAEYSNQNMKKYQASLLHKLFVTKTCTAIDKQEIDDLVKIDKEFRAQYLQMKQEADREEEETRRRAKAEEERQIAERIQMELNAKQAKLDKVLHARAGHFDESEFVPAEPAPRTRYIPQDEQMPAASSALLDKMQTELLSTKSQLSKALDEIERLEIEVRKEREQKDALSATVESLRRELEKARSANQVVSTSSSAVQMERPIESPGKSSSMPIHNSPGIRPPLHVGTNRTTDSQSRQPGQFSGLPQQKEQQNEETFMDILKRKISTTLTNVEYAIPLKKKDGTERPSSPRRISHAPPVPPSAPNIGQASSGITNSSALNDTVSFLNAQESILQVNANQGPQEPDDASLYSIKQNTLNPYMQTLICENDILLVDCDNQSMQSTDAFNTSTMSTGNIPESLMHGPNASFNHRIRSIDPSDHHNRTQETENRDDSFPLYVDSLPTNSNLSNSLLTTEGQQSAENNKPQTNFIMSDDGLVQRSADEAAARSSNILGHPFTVRHVLQDGSSTHFLTHNNLRGQMIFDHDSDSDGSLLTESVPDEPS